MCAETFLTFDRVMPEYKEWVALMAKVANKENSEGDQ